MKNFIITYKKISTSLTSNSHIQNFKIEFQNCQIQYAKPDISLTSNSHIQTSYFNSKNSNPYFSNHISKIFYGQNKP